MSPATEESVSDFGFDCVKALIDDKLELVVAECELTSATVYSRRHRPSPS